MMTPPASVRRARHQLAAYFALVALASGVCEAMIYRTRKPIESSVTLVLLLMWMPGIVGLALRLLWREGLRDVSLRWGGWRGTTEALRAWVYPLLVGFAAYGLAWGTGLAHFVGAPIHFAGLAPNGSVARFAFRLGLTVTIGVPMGAISAAGEELGWRGYMLTRLVDARVPRPVLVSGLVWGLWHTPLIVTGQYASGPRPWLSAVMFVLAILPEAAVFARVRLASGSVWPAVIAHAAWNSIIQGAFDPSTAGGGASETKNIWVGEGGVLVAAVSWVIAGLLLRGPWLMRRSTRDEAVVIAP